MYAMYLIMTNCCVVSSGVYRATWIPSHPTQYTLQVILDQELKGPRQLVVVDEAPQGSTETVQNVETLRLLQFRTLNSRGLRIRSSPTLQSPQVSQNKNILVTTFGMQCSLEDIWYSIIMSRRD